VTLVDTHTHAWAPDTDAYPWQAEVLPPGWEGAYTYDDLVDDMDEVGVDEAVVVTTPMYGRGPDANDYTIEAIEAYPERLHGVGLMEFFPEDPQAAAESFRRVVSTDGMLGVRMHAALAYAETPTEIDRQGDWFLDDRLDPMFDAAAQSDAAVFVFPKAQQLQDVATLVDDNPRVQFVVDHMAWPDETTDPHEAPWTDFEGLAHYDNVAVKVSSLPRSSDQAWPYEDLWPYVEHLLEWFGPERLMLGSDYPWMDDWATYDECLSWVERADVLSDRDRRYVQSETFRRIHG
jgi:L-fuconolactonase